MVENDGLKALLQDYAELKFVGEKQEATVAIGDCSDHKCFFYNKRLAHIRDIISKITINPYQKTIYIPYAVKTQ